MGPDDFDYELPAEAVAQEPLGDRPSARLLDTTGDQVAHRTVRDLPSLLGPGDVVVVNDTRVLPARLRFRRPTGGTAEVLLLHPVDGQVQDPVMETGACWEALVRPSRRLPPWASFLEASRAGADRERLRAFLPLRQGRSEGLQ